MKSKKNVQSKKVEGNIIVIFGASGDLSKRKLIPSIYSLFKDNALSSIQYVIGASRTFISDENYRVQTKKELLKLFPNDDEVILENFLKHIYYQDLDTQDVKDYVKIKNKILEVQEKHNISKNILFYLSTPPFLYPIIAKSLAKHCLNNEVDGYKRLIIEKPFGSNEETAKKLNKSLLKNYKEEQLYRIDHYLGKETVQNILVFRFANLIFENLWNSHFIDNVQIYANESLTIENRGGFYDKMGAMRDMIQNHLLQLLGIVAMEPPVKMDSYSIRNETLKVFQSIRKMTPSNIKKDIIIGQYEGYRNENLVDKKSLTETFVAIKFNIDNWRWKGVPFYIKTGKALGKRVSEVVINFKRTPLNFFHNVDKKEVSKKYYNQLVIRIQPNEGIKMTFLAKNPGSGFNTHEMAMNFYYKDFDNDKQIKNSYERLILDCLTGDSTLFARNDGVEACWSIIDPILKEINKNREEMLKFYKKGSNGPEESDTLLNKDKREWRYPCNKSGSNICDF